MKKFRVSIAGLMAVITILAVGFAALKNPTEPWASATFTITMVMLLLSLLGVGFRRGDKQLFWSGFATFGWGNLVFVLSTGALIPPRLFTSLILSYLTMVIPTPPPPNFQPGLTSSFTITSISTSGVIFNPSAQEPYFQIGHSLAVLIFGMLGAILVRVFAHREDRQS